MIPVHTYTRADPRVISFWCAVEPVGRAGRGERVSANVLTFFFLIYFPGGRGALYDTGMGDVI